MRYYYKNGVRHELPDLTQEELAQIRADEAAAAEAERTREPTAEERLAALEAAMLELVMGGTE